MIILSWVPNNIHISGDLPACRPHQILKMARQVFNTIGELSNPLFEAAPSNKLSFDDDLLCLSSICFIDCVSECWKETYGISASYADLQLAANFQFGNWTVSPNQR